MKLGNTDFRDDYAKDLSFTDFKKQYVGLLKGYDIKEAFKLLGGKFSKPKKVKVDDIDLNK